MRVVDMSVTKEVSFLERLSGQFRFEIFNVFNRVNLGNPVSALNSSNFGLITSASDPRIIQLALKYAF